MKNKYIWKPKVVARLIFKSKLATKAVCVIVAVLALVAYLLNWGSEARLNKGEWASWVQAVGSIAAVLLAIWVMRWQHARSLEREAESERSANLNMLKALRSDLRLFAPIVMRRLECPRLVWPNLNVELPIYRSFTGRIGLLENDRMRMEILNVYMRIGMFFGSADHFSTVTTAIHSQEQIRPKDQHRIDQMWDEVEASGPEMLRYIENTIGTLTGAIRDLEAERDHAGPPRSKV